MESFLDWWSGHSLKAIDIGISQLVLRILSKRQKGMTVQFYELGFVIMFKHHCLCGFTMLKPVCVAVCLQMAT